MHLTLGNGFLEAEVGAVELVLAEGNSEHGDNSVELEVVEAFLEGLVLVNNGDVGDLVELEQVGHAVLDQLGEFHGAFHRVGDTLDDHGILACLHSGEQVVGSAEVSADAYASPHSDFVEGETLLSLLYSSVLVSHFA